MKINKKTLIIPAVLIILLFITSLFANYYDTARVTTGHEPKLVLKTYSEKYDAVIYWGLGYKVVRYVGVSPNEPYENSLEIKMGSWFMPYKKTIYQDIYVEKMDNGTITKIDVYEDIATLNNLITNQKYINELCKGITDYKITIDKNVYNLKLGCKEISLEEQSAHISNEDMESIIKIIDKSN